MQTLQQAHADMFASCPHEIFVTLRFERDRITNDKALKCCQDFVRRVGKQYLTAVAGWAVVNRLHHPHAHLILFGHNRSIKELTTLEAERHWRYGSADAQQCWDHGASIYLAINMTPNAPDKSDFFALGINILKKHQQRINEHPSP